MYDRNSKEHPSGEDLSTDAEDNSEDNGDGSRDTAGAHNPQPHVVPSQSFARTDPRVSELALILNLAFFLPDLYTFCPV